MERPGKPGDRGRAGWVVGVTTDRKPLPHWHAYNESHLADFGQIGRAHV